MSLSLLLMFSCSTEKNTSVNRAFHYVTARYNGHWNANELLNVSMANFRASLEEDYYELIPIEALPDVKQVEALHSPIDTAISKVKKVIAEHSMPGLENASRKNAEHNHYIDENWLTIGRAHYLRRDYETAMRNFKFVNQYFSEDPSNYTAELWMAKVNMKLGKLTDAKFNLDRVNSAMEGITSSYKAPVEKKKKQSKAQKLNNSSTSKSKDAEPAKFPKFIRFELMVTNAEFQRLNKNTEGTIDFLEKSLEYAKNSEAKGRVNFVLGQLYEQQGNANEASNKYKKSTKYNIIYPMSFHATLRSALLKGGPKIQKDLEKMLKDAKNAEYKDQIYYTLGEMELNRGNEDLAMQHFTNSAFYSTKNTKQKAKSYLTMADLRYAKRDYIRAQKYYDSCVRATDDTFPKYDLIASKAKQLEELVIAVETAQLEDSLQRIARMDEDSQEKFLKDVIKKREEDERIRKQREAEKLRELSKNNTAFGTDLNAKGSGYWNNGKALQDGFNEFKKKWGQRDNEDNWRRSDKVPVLQMVEDVEGEVVLDETGQPIETVVEKDPLADLKKGLPVTEEDFENSSIRMEEALYKAGIIYKDQLNEKDLGVVQFEKILTNTFESEIDPKAAFQLYRLYLDADPTKANVQRDYILNNFPNSDFAKFMRDPDYFVKLKERNALAEQEFVSLLERYNRGLYYPVMAKAESVLEETEENDFRPKFMLIYAMSKAQTTTDKAEVLPILEELAAQYPESEEGKRAVDLIAIIKNGYSKYEPAVFGNKTIYEYEEGVPQVLLIFLTEKDNVDLAKSKISDFTREFFPKSKLKVSTSLLGEESVIMVAEFPTEAEVRDYARKYTETRKYLLDLQKAKKVIISPKNLKLLYQTNKIDDYILFYEEYY